MTVGMGVPVRVAIATSQFMIGVTAVASFLVYGGAGLVQPLLAAPVVLGVAAGSAVGAQAAGRVPAGALEATYIVVVCAAGCSVLLAAAGVLNAG